MTGSVVWITGLSGSGKTTLARAMHAYLREKSRYAVYLDGDEVRRAISDESLGYTAPDRMVQVGRLQRMAKMLSDQGAIVIVAALYSHPDLLEWNRANLPDYLEVYLKASISLVRGRDAKGLYRGDVINVVGVDIPWHAPKHPHLTFSADSLPDINNMVKRTVVWFGVD